MNNLELIGTIQAMTLIGIFVVLVIIGRRRGAQDEGATGAITMTRGSM